MFVFVCIPNVFEFRRCGWLHNADFDGPEAGLCETDVAVT